MAERHSLDELEQDLEEVLSTFRLEFNEGGPTYVEQLGFIEPIMNFYFQMPPSRQLTFQPLFENLVRNAQNLKAVDEAFKNFPPGAVRFYGKCFLYLVNAEGMFDEAITFLYGLFLAYARKSINLDELQRKPFSFIKTQMTKAKAPTSLFEGLDRHVRNAIAHCRFHYDEKSDRIELQDILEPKPTLFSQAEFDELYNKLDNPWHIISHLIFLNRIIALVMMQDVLRAGELDPLR